MSPDPWPDRMDMIRQLREAAGLFAGAMPVSPKQAWEEAIERVGQLREAAIRVGIDAYVRDRSPKGRGGKVTP